MGLKPKAPKAPDPVETAKAEAAANRINEYTPGGGKTVYGYTNPKNGQFVAGQAPDRFENAQTAVKVIESRPEQQIRLAVQPASISAAKNISAGIQNIGAAPTAPSAADYSSAPAVPQSSSLPARPTFDVSGAPAAPTQEMLFNALGPGAQFRSKGLQGFEAPNGSAMFSGASPSAQSSQVFQGAPARAASDGYLEGGPYAPDASQLLTNGPARADASNLYRNAPAAGDPANVLNDAPARADGSIYTSNAPQRADGNQLFDQAPDRAVYDRNALGQTAAPNAQGVQQGLPGRASFDRAAVDQTAAPSGFGYNDDIASALFGRNTQLMDKQVDRQHERLMTNLQARGIPIGSEAFNETYGDFNDGIGDTYSRMAMDATLAAGQEDSRRFAQQGAARDRAFGEQSSIYSMGADERARAFGENVTGFNLEGQQRDRAFGELSSLYSMDADARARAVSENQTNYGMQADARSRALGENQTQIGIDQSVRDQAVSENQMQYGLDADARARSVQESNDQYRMNADARNTAVNENALAFNLAGQARDRAGAEFQTGYNLDKDARATAIDEGRLNYDLQADQRARAVTENQQLFQQQSQARDQRFSELESLYRIDADKRAQTFNENRTAFDAASQARDRSYREASDLYGFQADQRQGMQADQNLDYQRALADRSRQINEGVDFYNMQRNQRDAAFNEMAAVLGGQYSPTAAASVTPNTPGINVGGIVNSAYQAQSNAYNQKMQTGLGAAAGLANIGGALLLSSQVAKDEIPHHINPMEMLDKVLRMQLRLWRYKESSGAADGSLHFGPWAEEFNETFGLSEPNGVFPTDPAFVALGAIKGLFGLIVEMQRTIGRLLGDPITGNLH